MQYHFAFVTVTKVSRQDRRDGAVKVCQWIEEGVFGAKKLESLISPKYTLDIRHVVLWNVIVQRLRIC
jgi:hypothetical protein